MDLYNKYSDYLKRRYGTKVYKLPINIPVTCPNRDGSISRNGCVFCGDEGAGFENLSNTLGVREQLETNMKYIKQKYNAAQFIAYFQNFSNTYLPSRLFSEYIHQAVTGDITAIYISTRPDCITNDQLDFLKSLKTRRKLDIVLEIGLQTANHHTLKILNRGHSLAEFTDAVLRTKSRGLKTCAHYITDLPWDTQDDVIEGSKILSALGVNQVKLHSLYILRDTKLGEMYQDGIVSPVCIEEYIQRTITFLEYLSPEIVIQRLIGRAPKDRTLFCNWGMSWWKIRDMVEEKMYCEGSYQGKRFNYLTPKTTHPAAEA